MNKMDGLYFEGCRNELKPFIPVLEGSAKILEIGCGKGGFSAHFALNQRGGGVLGNRAKY